MKTVTHRTETFQRNVIFSRGDNCYRGWNGEDGWAVAHQDGTENFACKTCANIIRYYEIQEKIFQVYAMPWPKDLDNVPDDSRWEDVRDTENGET